VATKFGVAGLTQSLAKELGPRGIRVNSVCPVLVKTSGLIDALAREGAPGAMGIEMFFEGFISSQTALGRLPSEQDVAKLCLFLASESANSITGQSINVDCGTLPT
jgi:3-oxoacyl-[acyl-carrier protein] reductase/meso-butanediol dehydrogenase/(S,S)-butanediol dehydrogenase/diacetyl reductase